MSVQDYMSALKLGKKEYHACVNKGKYPYLPVMENMMEEKSIDSEVSLGIDQIPLRLVVGTCTAGRTNAFADNWMPILEWGSEFSAKWASLSDSQVNEGIRDPIKVYEYMNKFYVLEGNKRVSVLSTLRQLLSMHRLYERFLKNPMIQMLKYIMNSWIFIKQLSLMIYISAKKAALRHLWIWLV